MKFNSIPIFEFLIDPNDKAFGMKAISLVDKPAIESQFIAFNIQEKPVTFKFKDEKKRIIAGLALIPNKLIYRVDEETNIEYMGYFSAETIEVIMDKFMKESIEGTTKNVNFQHDSTKKAQAHLIESYILRTPFMVEAVKKQGIEDAILGSWYVAYKFDKKEDYDKAVNGEFTGFSIEVITGKELKMKQDNPYNNDHINNFNVMTKIKTYLNKFRILLEEMSSDGIFEDVVVPESGKSLRIGEIGQPVMWVSVDETTGEEVIEPVLEGEYILEDGRIVVVDAMGNLLEIKEAGTPVEPVPEEDMNKTPKEGDNKTPKEGDKVDPLTTTVLAEPPVPEEAPAPSGETKTDVAGKTLGEIIDVTKDGEYTIKVVVADGMITEATVDAAQNLIDEMAAKDAEIATLKEQLAKPITKPVFVEFDKYIEKPKPEELSKLSNLELVKRRLKLV